MAFRSRPLVVGLLMGACASRAEPTPAASEAAATASESAVIVPSAIAPASAAPSSAPPSKEELTKRAANMKAGDELEIGGGTVIKALRVGATNPSHSGWHRARSTGGGFSVELPYPFNDTEVRAPIETERTELRTFLVTTRTEGRLTWVASCMARPDGKFSKPNPEADALPDGKVVLHPIEAKGTPVKAYQRAIDLKDRRCFLIVEAQGGDPLPFEGDRRRFFESLKVEGKPVF